jgi:transcription antitermination factor NusG
VVGVGDVATILEGHFDGFECRVVDVSGVNAKVMLDIFGRDTPTELLLSSLSKLDGMTSAR